MKTANRRQRGWVFSLVIFAFMFVAACKPVVHLCLPAQGPQEGGNAVRIYGTDLGVQQGLHLLQVLFQGRRCNQVIDLGADQNGEYIEVIAPAGDRSGQVKVEVFNGEEWSDEKYVYTYTAPDHGINYSLVGEVLPADFAAGLHVREGNFDMESGGRQIPEVLVVADRGAATVIRNDSTDGRFEFNRDDDALPWNRWNDGQVTDITFLDTDEDGIDDLLYVTVSNLEVPEKRQDRLYRVTVQQDDRYTFTEVVGGLPSDSQNSMSTIVTRDLDAQGNLYIVLAGGDFLSKENPNVDLQYDRCRGSLRILRYDGTTNSPHFVQVPGSNLPTFSTIMTDVKVLDVDDDGLGDILVTAFPAGSAQPGAVVLMNEGVDEYDDPIFEMDESRFPETLGQKVFGSAVGDFDADGDDDFMLFRPQEVTVYRNEGAGDSAEIPAAIEWQEYHRGDKRTTHDAALVDEDSDGCPEFVVAAAQVPYILENRTPAGGQIRLVEKDLSRPDNSFVQTYTALGVVVADFDADGFEDIFFSDSYEQDRLWRCGPGLEPTQEATGTSLPAGGAMSTRVLRGDIDRNGLVDAVAINLDFQPDIYLNHGESGRLEDGSYLFSDPFPEEQGGWDGALVDLNQDGWLDLVVAGGAWGSSGRINSIYHWDIDRGGLVKKGDALPNDRLNTRGVAAGDLNGDGRPDLVFVNQTGEDLSVHFNCARNGQWGYFNECDEGGMTSVSIYDLGAAYHGVALVTYSDGRLSDIIVGGSTLFGNTKIFVYRNNDNGTFSGPQTVSGLESCTGIAARFTPMNLDQPSMNGTGEPIRDDFFVSVKGGSNIILQRDAFGHFVNVSDRLRDDETEDASAATWGAAVGDLNGDGWDDIVAAHCPPGGVVTGLKIYINSADAAGNRHLEEITGQTLEGYFNKDGAFDALIVDLDGQVGGDERPEIVVVNDGQNRLLMPN